jgi:hypothetical protein
MKRHENGQHPEKGMFKKKAEISDVLFQPV